MNTPTSSQIHQWLEEDRREKEKDKEFASRLSGLISSQTRWSKYFEDIKKGVEEPQARQHILQSV